MKKPKYWLDIGLTGAKFINMDDRPDLTESLASFGNDFQPIHWPSDKKIQREDNLTILSWLRYNMRTYQVPDNDPEVVKFFMKVLEVGQKKVEVVEVQWDEESVLILKY